MKFECKEVVYSAESNWDEIISITFVSKPGNYLSLNSLIYEDEIGIELNEQTNYISTMKSGFKYHIYDESLSFDIINPVIKKNIQDLSFEVSIPANINSEKLKKAFELLVKSP